MLLSFGVIDASTTSSPEETQEEEETQEVPPGLEKWAAEGPIYLSSSGERYMYYILDYFVVRIDDVHGR